MKTHQLILTINENDYITLESGTLEYVTYMLNWYKAHERFFNGTFSIIELSK